VKGEGGRQLLAIILHTFVAGVKSDKDLFSRDVPKIGNNVNVILYQKNLLKTAEIIINGCI
jgi:hypothetical protein